MSHSLKWPSQSALRRDVRFVLRGNETTTPTLERTRGDYLGDIKQRRERKEEFDQFVTLVAELRK